MCNGINGNYNAQNYSVKPELTKSTNQLKTVDDVYPVKKDDLTVDMQVLNSNVPITTQINPTAKPEQIYNDAMSKVPNKEEDTINSLVSTIENSRNITVTPMPVMPASQGQLIVKKADVQSSEHAQLINDLVNNFSQVDTNKDNLLSSDEVTNFINGDY